MNRRYVLALDLKDDPALIAAYERHHEAVWPEVIGSLREAGVCDMEIYRFGNRLMMVIEVDEAFSFAAKAVADARNPTVQAWEALMGQFQQPLPGAPAGEKWQVMRRIFKLDPAP